MSKAEILRERDLLMARGGFILGGAKRGGAKRARSPRGALAATLEGARALGLVPGGSEAGASNDETADATTDAKARRQEAHAAAYSTPSHPIQMPGTLSNPAGLSLRRVRPSDWSALRSTRLEAIRGFPAAFGVALDVERARSARDWRDRCESSAYGHREALFVVEPLNVRSGEKAGTNFRGMAGVMSDPRHVSAKQLVSMWVSPNARAHGLGGLLLDRCLEFCRQAGAKSVWLMVAHDAEDAMALYESRGFERTGYEEAHRVLGAPQVYRYELKL